jgi:hypothetical protein
VDECKQLRQAFRTIYSLWTPGSQKSTATGVPRESKQKDTCHNHAIHDYDTRHAKTLFEAKIVLVKSSLSLEDHPDRGPFGQVYGQNYCHVAMGHKRGWHDVPRG